MAVELSKEISLIDDEYKKYVRNSKDLNEEFQKDVIDHMKTYISQYVYKNPIIPGNESIKEQIVNRCLRDTRHELEKANQERQDKYNDVLHKLQTLMIEDYTKLTMEEIRYQKEACLLKLEHIDDEYIDESQKIISKNFDGMADEFKELESRRDGLEKNTLLIDQSIDKLKDNVKFKVDYNKRYYIDKSDNYARDAIKNTADYLLKAKERDMETKEKETEEKLSQQFKTDNPNDERYEEYKEANENNSYVDGEEITKEMNMILGVFGISIKIENGRLVGKNANSEELTVEYNNDYPDQIRINMTDNQGNKFEYGNNGRQSFVESKIINAPNENKETYPTYTLYDNERNTVKVYLSNETEMYINLNDRRIVMNVGFEEPFEFDIDPNLLEVKDIINAYKDRTAVRK